MKPIIRPLLLALLFALPLGAAEVLPSAGKAVGIVRDDTPGSWAVVSQDFNSVEVKEFDGDSSKGFLGCYFEGPAGRYLAIKSGAGKLKTFAVVLGSPSPVPGPGPGPEPTPNPTPVPQPTVGPLRVLILEETQDRSKYPKDVTGSYLSVAVASYLKTHTSTANGFQDWAIWDDDTPTPSEFSAWADILAKAKLDSGANTAAAKEPWIVIEQKDSTGKLVTVHSGQVTADLMATLKKFGGP